MRLMNIEALFKSLLYSAYKMLWECSARFGVPVSGRNLPSISVVIATFSNERGAHLRSQVKNVLKCGFVQELVVSNHNPEFDLEKWLPMTDARMRIISSSEKTSCSHRWHVAKQCKNEYVLVLDDDVLLFPNQVKALYKAFLSDADVPHGLAGKTRGEYSRNCNREVDYLVEAYFVSKIHIGKYLQLENILERRAGLAINSSDFLLISKCGNTSSLAKIHNIGPVLRCRTYRSRDIALHRNADFDEKNRIFRSILENELSQLMTEARAYEIAEEK